MIFNGHDAKNISTRYLSPPIKNLHQAMTAFSTASTGALVALVHQSSLVHFGNFWVAVAFRLMTRAVLFYLLML